MQIFLAMGIEPMTDSRLSYTELAVSKAVAKCFLHHNFKTNGIHGNQVYWLNIVVGKKIILGLQF